MTGFDFGALSFFLDAAMAIKEVVQSKRVTPDQKREMLAKFEAALVETEIYINEVRRKSGQNDHMTASDTHRNFETEAQLARLWREAAVTAQDRNGVLQSIAYGKSGFWIDRENWPREKLVRYGYDIESAREEIRKLNG